MKGSLGEDENFFIKVESYVFGNSERYGEERSRQV
jgi:hypothetical protein